MKRIRDITSDSIESISLTNEYPFPMMELLRVTTEKGMVLIVDKKRFDNLRVGDPIEVYLEVKE